MGWFSEFTNSARVLSFLSLLQVTCQVHRLNYTVTDQQKAVAIKLFTFLNTYYHISNNPSCTWKAGDEVYFGHEYNFYWRSFLEKEPYINLNGDKRPADQVINYALNWYARNEPFPAQMNCYHFNPVFTLKEATDCLGQSMRIIRELTFEAIRKEFHPKLPSRHKCIWLVPENKLSMNFWKNAVHGDNKRVFKVETEGIIHRAANKWLAISTIPLNEINSMAHNYWKGIDVGGFEDEILFTGKLKIIEELPMILD